MKSINKIEKPLAITMWDSSWIRRRYRGGGFEDWDQALDELIERGYNAVRIDAFPHLIAKGPDGSLIERYRDIPGQSPHHFGLAYWGNQWTVYIEPRKSIIEFIKKCEDRNIYVALSTWFKPTEDLRNAKIEGAEELVRVWDETLEYLAHNNCLKNVIYVDVLNEYPFGNCMWWLHKKLDTMTQPEKPDGKLNNRQITFYRDFIDDVLEKLKNKWQDLSFAVSKTFGHFSDYDRDRNLSNFDFLDMHLWINNCPDFVKGTGYVERIRKHGRPEFMYEYQNVGHGGYGLQSKRIIPADVYYEEIYKSLITKWNEHKEEYEKWMRETISQIAEFGKTVNIPVGNTEGWGLVDWFEHPSLEWQIQKECGLIAAKYAQENGYWFNCSSNMCEPQFLGLWRDLDWHREVTGIIKSGEIK
ncbi:MAG: hypothetical protein GF364_07240 [Candidatus Lokiarchaeota archaeon]|nr:hypothetical protein [Candidatus Lokiarchaeota archaeon]